MALCKRGNIWWIRISHQKIRIQQSTGTSSKIEAQRLHDKIKSDLWKCSVMQEKPNKDWEDAVIRWCKENDTKKSLRCDKSNFRWLHPHLTGISLKKIDRKLIETIAHKKEQEGASAATVNRLLALIRAVLRKAERDWEWLDKAPSVRMRREDNKRIRWITPAEADLLRSFLPVHLRDAMDFALYTGLRESNITNLEWSEIDFDRCHAFIPAHKSKSGKPIAVPLNTKVMDILKQRKDDHPKYVFVFRGHRLVRFNNTAWRKALKRSGIRNFKWHDLRHTWASWHVQNGTSLHELQQLGGWASLSMVLRYAHLSSQHLKSAAERIAGTNLVHRQMEGY